MEGSVPATAPLLASPAKSPPPVLRLRRRRRLLLDWPIPCGIPDSDSESCCWDGGGPWCAGTSGRFCSELMLPLPIARSCSYLARRPHGCACRVRTLFRVHKMPVPRDGQLGRGALYEDFLRKYKFLESSGHSMGHLVTSSSFNNVERLLRRSQSIPSASCSRAFYPARSRWHAAFRLITLRKHLTLHAIAEDTRHAFSSNISVARKPEVGKQQLYRRLRSHKPHPTRT